MNNPYIIGITGSYGKTSCAYTLHEYFKYLGYSSCLMSSTKLDMPNVSSNSWHNEIQTQKGLEYYLYQAKGSDFLVIEVHEESLKNNIYKNINFDCKVLVNFEKNFNQHRSAEEYLSLKANFFNEGECVRVINRNIDNYDSFNTEEAIVFSTKEYDGCDVYPLSKKLKFKNSTYQLMVGDERVTVNSYLNGNGYKNLTTVVSVLYALDMFDSDSFLSDFFADNAKTQGRYELHKYNKKNVIIDSGNTRSLVNFVNETEDIKDYNVKGLISIAGGLSDDFYEELISKGFVSLNKYLVADPVVRKHCLTFGGNLYNACHGLSKLPDKVAYQEVVSEIGEEFFLDFSQTKLDLPSDLVQEMIDMTIMLGTDDLTRNPKYCQNFWWRSITVFKGYFTINYDKFIKIYDELKSVGDTNLTSSCEYVKQMIDYTVSQYRQFGDAMSESDVKKVYLTMNNSNDWNNELELKMYQKFFKQDTEIYVKRQDALDAMVKESADNDILYIAGRGDRNLYKKSDGSFDKFTDSEYIEKLFNEVNTHGNN